MSRDTQNALTCSARHLAAFPKQYRSLISATFFTMPYTDRGLKKMLMFRLLNRDMICLQWGDWFLSFDKSEGMGCVCTLGLITGVQAPGSLINTYV